MSESAIPEDERLNTEVVRNNFAFGLATAPLMEEQARNVNWPEDGMRDHYKGWFDEWFTEIERSIREQALAEAEEAILAPGHATPPPGSGLGHSKSDAFAKGVRQAHAAVAALRRKEGGE